MQPMRRRRDDAALLALLAACASTAPAPSSAPAPSTTAVDPPAKQEPATSVLAMDGKHVAAERVYEGRCAPKGSRGGCITITLRPDGTYKNSSTTPGSKAPTRSATTR